MEKPPFNFSTFLGCYFMLHPNASQNDVAKMLGVGQMTVSRLLNGKGKINPKHYTHPAVREMFFDTDFDDLMKEIKKLSLYKKSIISLHRSDIIKRILVQHVEQKIGTDVQITAMSTNDVHRFMIITQNGGRWLFQEIQDFKSKEVYPDYQADHFVLFTTSNMPKLVQNGHSIISGVYGLMHGGTLPEGQKITAMLIDLDREIVMAECDLLK